MRKVAVFTGTRAEYGLLCQVIKELDRSPEAALQLIVGGMHLSPEFGYTVSKIEEDGYQITERLEFLLSSDSPVGISKSMGLALISAGECFARIKPDLLVVLGDRFESLAVAQAAMVAQIPIAHIHGGETTEGLIDEAVRHSLTKMSHLHFTTTEPYRKRVIQLGEAPERVFNVGAPGVDNVHQLKLLDRDELSSELQFSLGDKFFLVTYHPVTLEKDGGVASFQKFLQALDYFPEYKVILTYPNADTYGRLLFDYIEEYRKRWRDRIFVTQSLGQVRYLSALKHSTAVLGNSSSGLIEAPAFHVPTVNIGNRQRGRIAGESVLHCEDSVEVMKDAITKVVSVDFQKYCSTLKNPYGVGCASSLIVETLLSYPLENIIQKSFYDIEF
ncbi:UDP-N-acetylglucosamine 2-epimerase [Halodesulfovibrio aestuarii]|uniref:UDP-N-acetylglucosamine 2-epimerase n=1 Tax=Halodesulfovibrio aestuarii TaxID=126333 RepID=UPI00040828C9